MQRLFAMLALTTLAIAGWSAVRKQHHRQASSRTPAQPVPPWKGDSGDVEPSSPARDAAIYADAAERDASA